MFVTSRTRASFGSAATRCVLAFRKARTAGEALANPLTESRQMIAAAFVKARRLSVLTAARTRPGVSQW